MSNLTSKTTRFSRFEKNASQSYSNKIMYTRSSLFNGSLVKNRYNKGILKNKKLKKKVKNKEMELEKSFENFVKKRNLYKYQKA